LCRVLFQGGGTELAEPVLAIDFGTFASAAKLVIGGEVKGYVPDPAVQPENASWRSAVYWDGARLLVGGAAEKQRTTDPHRYRAEFKPLLREEVRVALGGDDGAARGAFLPEELVREMLTAMRQAAEAKYLVRISRAVLTVPPSYFEPGDNRADLMLNAAHEAGFTERVELIAEPVAAAMADPAGQPFSHGDRVLVYDFGGGTFDAAVVHIGIDGTRAPARSLDDCGGIRVDEAIEQWLCDHGASSVAALIDRDTSGDDGIPAARDLIRLREFCTELKVSLSQPGRDSVERFFEPVGHNLRLKGEELDARAKYWIGQTISCCRELLRDAKTDPGELAAILLVGGSSRLRGVRDRLSREFGVDIRPALEPTLAVVDGAASFAARSAERVSVSSAGDPRVRPVRWDVPGDHATVVRWHVSEGDYYGPDTELAELRLRTGEIYRLADAEGGAVRTRHVGPGQSVRSGDWLLTAWRLVATRWDLELQASHVTPALSEWTVFAGTRRGTVHALAAATHEQRWQRTLGVEVTAPLTVDHGDVYVGCRDGAVYLLDEHTGNPAGPPLRVSGGVTSAPLPFGDRVWVVSDARTLFAVVRDGPPQEFPCDPSAAPVLAGGVICVRGTDHRLVSIDPDAARVLPGWGTDLSAGYGQPGVGPGSIYEYFGDRGIRRISALTGEVEADTVFEPQAAQEPKAGGAFGRALQGTRARVTSAAAPLFRTAPVYVSVPGGRPMVVAGTTDGRLAAFDADTLETVGNRRLTGASLHFLMHYRGVLYATDDKRIYPVIARPDLPVRTSYATGGTITAEPASGHGALYVITNDGPLRMSGGGTLRAFPCQAERPLHD
jgi:outer membrane protein assembly factor BamB/actin-like ATPase involved in cell morphogenesis